MKNIIILVLSLAFFIGSQSCKKSSEDTFAKVPSPDWKADTSSRYPVSMTAVVRIPDNLKVNSSGTDKMAAFIQNECRGVGTVIKINNENLYFIMIRGNAAEQNKIKFKYYFTKTSYMFETAEFLPFTVDAQYGKTDSPEILDLHGIK